MTDRGVRPSPGGQADTRPSVFASLRMPGYPQLYAAGFLFSTSRWGLGFLAAFMANELTGSPRAVQLTGAALWAPLLLAGVVAGWLADRFDRRTLLIGAVAVLMPAVIVVGSLALGGRLVVWFLYPLMVAVGLTQVVDLTSRRTLVLDLVGPGLIDNAMALESLATAFGLALGVVAGGAAIELLGVGQAFFVVAGILTVAGVLFSRFEEGGDRRATAQVGGGGGPRAGGDDGIAAALRLVVENKRLRVGLGVTVVGNVFYFSHTPLVPVIADGLGAGPLGAGLLASAGGLGMMVSSLGVARLQPPRGPTYVAGPAIALASVTGVWLFDSYVPVFVSLLIAATGFGLFASTQSVVIMTSVDHEHRGRAMGLLSMAIGALPLGMYSLGEVAERVGAPKAIALYATTGLVTLLIWTGRRIELLSSE